MMIVVHSPILRTIPVLIAVCLVSFPAYAKYGGGSGTAVDPYQIWTAEQLNSIGTQRSDWDKCFKLMADIDLGQLGQVPFNVIGVRPAYGRPFTGVFDGNGKTISNFTCTRSDMASLGFLGGVQGTKALIENLILKGVAVDAGTGGHVGALVGYLEGGKVSRCHVEGGSVSGRFSVGGLVGTSEGAVVNCSASVIVSASDINGGGLIGRNFSTSTVASCYAAGQVSAGSQAGGLVADNLGSISDSYSTTQTSASQGAGGLTASNSGTIQKCYATGKVSAPATVGGLVAVLSGKGSVTNSFWDVQASGQSISAGGTGQSTVQMETAATFAGWDFVSTWTIQDGLGYPTLQWEANLFPAPTVTTIQKVSGDYQWALAGSKPADPLVVCVRDQDNKPIANMHVDFTVAAGDSTIAPVSAVTDPNGWASTELTLGPTAGPSQVEVTVGSLSASFNVAALTPGYGEGSGTADDPYQIQTAEQMHVIGTEPNDWNKHFKLTADVDLSVLYGVIGPWPFQMIAPGDDSNEGTARFTGVFDGDKHMISHAIIAGGSYSGLFGRLAAGAEVRDLGVVDVNVVAFGGYSGGLVGESSGTVTRCYSTGIVHGYWWRIAGLVGWNRGDVTQSYSTCTVIGNDYIGGLVGENGDDNLARPATVTQCFSTGTVTSSFFGIGGLVGLNSGGQVTQSYSTGAVTGEQMVGGLVGWNSWGASVSYCYSTGAIQGASSVGGLVGNNTGTVTSSYWDTQTSGYAASAGGIGRTTVNLKKASTFVDWDFTVVWTINEGVEYPKLRMQPKYSGGSGMAQDPYRIATVADLIALGETPGDYDKHFLLNADINLDPNLAGRKVFDRAVIAPDVNDTGYSFQGTPFAGVFDGNGHTVSHLTITGKDYLGLFGQLGSAAEVKNLGVVHVSITGSGSYVGGLAGSLSSSSNGPAASVTNAYSTGTANGKGPVGGLVGSNSGDVSHCYSTSAVSGNSSVGGLVGGNNGTVARCYSTGAVAGNNYVGGLVGSNSGSVLNSVWDMETSGLLGSSGGVGLTTAEMRDPYMLGLNGFANDPNWVLDAGRDYPRLAWEGTQGDIIPQPSIDWLEGGGTAEDPYRVDTAEQLIFLGRAGALCDRHFVLGANIDLDPNLANGRVFPQAVIPTLTGVFDGKGYSISHLTITGTNGPGLFGQLGTGAEVRNLGVVDVNITGSGLCAGGLVGINEGTVAECHSTGSVTGSGLCGGLVGINSGAMRRCYSTCVVSGSLVGGLVGVNAATVGECYSTSSVTGTGPGACAGGLIGANFGTVSRCYSTGAVSGTQYAGGLVGWNLSGTLTQCYSTGVVRSEDVAGGLIGMSDGKVDRCFWNTDTSGQSVSAGGFGLSTAELQRAATFAGWGIDAVWTIDEGKGYPRLAWEQMPGEIITTTFYSGGSGTAEDPYQIATPADLFLLGRTPAHYDKHFILTADIDLDPNLPGRKVFDKAVIAADTDPTEDWFQGTQFTGVFDGNGHTISHLTITGAGNVGLFGQLALGAEVRNLGVVDVNIIGSGSVVGGLVGLVEGGTVTHCYSTGSITGDIYVGGLAGSMVNGSVTRCHSTCTVNGSRDSVGGFVGGNLGGLVAQCYSSGSVNGARDVGGLVGSNYGDGTVLNSYSTATVSGSNDVGGLVGWNESDVWGGGHVTNCYSTGAVSGSSNVGGLVGYNVGYNNDGYGSKGEVTACFWDTQMSGQAQSAGGTGKTTAQMQTAKTFLDTGWDFVGEMKNGTEDIWWINEGKDYPRLWFEQGHPLLASGPNPRNGSTNIPRAPILSWIAGGPGWQHDVYLGDDEAAVADATPAGAEIYRGRQPAQSNTYKPGNLEWNKTYYWRIDEVNEANPQTVCKGCVWSFTATDFILSRGPADGAINVIQSPVLTWKAGGPGLQYDVYFGETIDSVANATTASPGLYRGRLPAETTTYAPLGLKWGKTYYWRIDMVDEADPGSPWRSGVWSFTTAYFATSPYPPDGDQVDNLPSLIFTWVPVAPGLLYDIYFGEDEAAVTNATPQSAGLYCGRQTLAQTTYTPDMPELGKTYYWRIDGVDPADPSTPSKGRVWRFKTVRFAVATVVDDFESYTDAQGNCIFNTWIDGMTDGRSGSVVGNLIAPFTERTIIHSGKQSLSMSYNNTKVPYFSEVQRTWPSAQNWTTDGAHHLSLYFRGKTGNAPDSLYVAIQDSAGGMVVVTQPDMGAVGVLRWQEWRIPLRDLVGVNVAKVKKMTIGVGDRKTTQAGGTGTIYIDDICLMKGTP